MSTHTYALLDVSPRVYDEVAVKLRFKQQLVAQSFSADESVAA